MKTSPASQPELHVVLGAGQVGPLLTDILLDRGLCVRVIRRGGRGALRAGLEWAQADLSDAEAASEACKGAAVIYDCTNPASYASWPTTLAPLKRGIRAAATRTGALLVQLDNLYMYGSPPDGVLRETTPERPVSEKGRLRAALSDELLAAVTRGELRACVGRAADFFGPGAGSNSLYGDACVRNLARGRGALAFGDPSLPRSYSYVPDVAAGLATMGAHPERSAGKIFHLPVAWKTGSTRALTAGFAAELGVRPRVWRLPSWVFSVLGLVSKDLGGVREMLYQWEAPYVVDDSLFEQTFGVKATPVEVALRESVRAAGVGPVTASRLASV